MTEASEPTPKRAQTRATHTVMRGTTSTKGPERSAITLGTVLPKNDEALMMANCRKAISDGV